MFAQWLHHLRVALLFPPPSDACGEECIASWDEGLRGGA